MPCVRQVIFYESIKTDAIGAQQVNTDHLFTESTSPISHCGVDAGICAAIVCDDTARANLASLGVFTGCGDESKPRLAPAIVLDLLAEHGAGTHPQTRAVVQGTIDHQRLVRFTVPGNADDLVLTPLVVTITALLHCRRGTHFCGFTPLTTLNFCTRKSSEV